MSENDLELFFLHIKSLTSPSPAYRRDGLRRVRPTVAFVSLVSWTMEFVSLVLCPLWRLSPWYPAHCGVCLPRILPIVTFIMVSCPLLSFVLVSCPLWRLSPKDLTHCDVYDGLLSNLSFVHCPGILSTFSFVLVSCPLWRLSRYPVHFVLCPGNLPTVAFVLVSCPLWRLSRYPAHFVLCPCILTNLFFVLVSCPRCPLSWYPAHCLVCLPGFLCTVGPTYSICVRLHGVHCAVCSVHDKKNCRSNTKISKQNHLQIQNCIIHFWSAQVGLFREKIELYNLVTHSLYEYKRYTDRI